jgi:hypothetical protein
MYLLLAVSANLLGQPLLPSITPGHEEIVAVSSRASADYIRAKLPDGSFQPETYAFGKGGKEELVMVDSTIDSVTFAELVKMLSVALAQQNYVPTKDPNETKLLIMVYWGTTYGLKDMNIPYYYGPHPNQVLWNAWVLGYSLQRKQVDEGAVEDLLHNRYFVVLMAYDFRLMWKEKKPKLLWVTRFSMRQIGHDFRLNLPAMARYASRYFGHESHGLIYNQIPEGHVEVGEPTVIDVDSPKK